MNHSHRSTDYEDKLTKETEAPRRKRSHRYEAFLTESNGLHLRSRTVAEDACSYSAPSTLDVTSAEMKTLDIRWIVRMTEDILL